MGKTDISQQSFPEWYPNLNEKMTKKIQINENKCIRFSLKMHHISEEELTYNFVNNTCSYYLNRKLLNLPQIVG